MLHIVLVILKMTGILLAVLLALLLLLVFCLCFVPLRYRLYVRYDKKWYVRGRFRYLGPLLMLRLEYEEGLKMKLCIFGIPVNGSFYRKWRRRRQGAVDEEEEELAGTSSNSVEEEPKQYGADFVMRLEEEVSVLPDREDEHMFEKGKTAQKEKQKAPSEFGRRVTLLGRLRLGWLRFKAACRSFFRMLGNGKNTIVAIREVYEDDGVRAGIRKGKDEFFRLFRKCKPGSIKGTLKIGFEDPFETGKLLAVLAVVRSMWNYHISIVPDFEQKILETEISAKGSIRGIWLLRLGWRLMLDKDIRYAKKQVEGIRKI